MTLVLKVLILLLLAVIVISLVEGMILLSRNGGRTRDTGVVKALTVRIALSLVLFALLMVGGASGLLAD